MVGFDPRAQMVPAAWSLAVEDTLGLVFWTKDPLNLIRDVKLLTPYPLVIHLTLTGWEEVEIGAPNLALGLELMRQTVDTFGVSNLVWRFSPIPMVPDVVGRFEAIAKVAESLGLRQVYVSFLQPNDSLPESRSLEAREALLEQLGAVSGIKVLVCKEGSGYALAPNLEYGVCESGTRFGATPRCTEHCGCALAVDPFTITESCTMGCLYCYSADKTLAPSKLAW
jgi:hypothetical protein